MDNSFYVVEKKDLWRLKVGVSWLEWAKQWRPSSRDFFSSSSHPLIPSSLSLSVLSFCFSFISIFSFSLSFFVTFLCSLFSFSLCISFSLSLSFFLSLSLSPSFAHGFSFSLCISFFSFTPSPFPLSPRLLHFYFRHRLFLPSWTLNKVAQTSQPDEFYRVVM